MTGLPSDHPDDVVRVVVDGTRRHATVDSHLTDDRLLVAGAYDGPDRARDPAGATDYLAQWADERGLEVDRAVLVDVVSEGFLYGLREPGHRTVYDDSGPRDRDGGLDDIARRLGDG